MKKKVTEETKRVISIVSWGIFSILVVAFLAFFILMGVLYLF